MVKVSIDFFETFKKLAQISRFLRAIKKMFHSPCYPMGDAMRLQVRLITSPLNKEYIGEKFSSLQPTCFTYLLFKFFRIHALKMHRHVRGF